MKMGLRKKQRVESGSKRVRREPSDHAPHSLTLGVLGMIVAVSAVFVICGTWLLSMQFEARDYEMEARRRQQDLFAARDGLKDKEAQVGSMHRDEFLREAALGPLGMIDPLPVSFSEMRLDAERKLELEKAAREAREALRGERVAVSNLLKEMR
jgi:hypothetical protein